jgi:hypothetical protein
MSVPVPTTPSDLITLALKQANVVGVGQVASAEDMNDSFNLLNMMMAQFQRRRYMIYELITVSKQATGAISYSVGPGGDFDVPRPSKIESAFFRQNQTTTLPVDYPFEILRAREDYNRISIKNLNAFPRYIFYDAAYPIGNVFPWPLPNAQYEMFLTVMSQLQNFQTINDQLAMPPEYSAALMWNLALELGSFYGLPLDAVVAGKAKASLVIIKESNAQIPLLQMPTALRGNNSGTYNVYGDFYLGSNP